MKYFVLIIIAFSILNCKQDKLKKTKKVTSITTKEKFKDVLKFNKNSAINKYGKPYSAKKFILNDAQGEFRNQISSHYSRKLRQSEKIKIEEITWKINMDSLITVWYEKKNKKSIPKEYLIWEDGSEF